MPGKHRKHTPIVSEAQRGLFGAEYARRKAGESPQIPSLKTKDIKSHLQEAGGKKLPEKVKSKTAKKKTAIKKKASRTKK